MNEIVYDSFSFSSLKTLSQMIVCSISWKSSTRHWPQWTIMRLYLIKTETVKNPGRISTVVNDRIRWNTTKYLVQYYDRKSPYMIRRYTIVILSHVVRWNTVRYGRIRWKTSVYGPYSSIYGLHKARPGWLLLFNIGHSHCVVLNAALSIRIVLRTPALKFS